ncbi:MAG: glycosyltransferase family 2 protein [Holosporaceae bacterium]|jgi:glycosyltransferase involved in cell wall biosynthesis|nr:glycosyltransferase family 2 protein [Holosporaceae bacterium]
MKSIAVLIPCYNEGNTIYDVVSSFKRHLPNAAVYVYDNCSEDDTPRAAQLAGAIVVRAVGRGKGNVVRKMFADVDADIFLMVDGDSTYDASVAPHMVHLMESSAVDMVVAVRKENSDTAYPGGHKIGNKMFNLILKILFHSTFQDIFSGYRVFSRRFVKTFPAMTNGFDIEVEMSIHALMLSIPFNEIESVYLERPANSHSKLHTFGDGFRILLRIISLLKETRPLFFFGSISLVLAGISLLMAYPLMVTFLETGLVPRLPTAVLSTGTMLISFLSLTCGMILDSISKARVEIKRLHYLGVPRE